ncbi:hypothetical protein OPU71_20205 [Niveibacterium sp. 24ML]|uniref:hypothetical protein n=1 Tax=Niveibacterium sp. 24ML TaxID=2985512 RepID=UPI0022713C87|nr:hypothetical protein [Niveibacterium sp. 24ML]MCX9158451.1 hypothetical protein [Niveibacterium sp. 24ML]
MTAPIALATSTAKPAAKQGSKSGASKSSTAKASAPNASGKKAKAGTASAKAKPAAAKPKTCYQTVKRNGKNVKVKKPCGGGEESVVSRSPINAQSLENSGTPLDGAPVKARSAPIRAYAVDGSTFFHNGRKIVIDGLGPETGAGLTHDHASQRLQRLLDGGALSIDPVAADENGAVRARVRVDGRDLSDLMKSQP